MSTPTSISTSNNSMIDIHQVRANVQRMIKRYRQAERSANALPKYGVSLTFCDNDCKRVILRSNVALLEFEPRKICQVKKTGFMVRMHERNESLAKYEFPVDSHEAGVRAAQLVSDVVLCCFSINEE